MLTNQDSTTGFIATETLQARVRAEITHWNNTGRGRSHLKSALIAYSDRLAELESTSRIDRPTSAPSEV